MKTQAYIKTGMLKPCRKPMKTIETLTAAVWLLGCFALLCLAVAEWIGG